MPPNKTAAGRKKDAIHFVNARPSSENERVRIRRLVRAHVGQWISDQTKDRSDADTQVNGHHEKAVDLDTEDSLFPSSSPSLGSPSHSSESGIRVNNSLVRSSGKVGRQTTPKAHGCPVHQDVVVGQFDGSYDQTGMAQGPVSMSDSPSPPPSGDHMESFGANVLDPFHTSPSQYDPSLVEACEWYCTSIFLAKPLAKLTRPCRLAYLMAWTNARPRQR